MFKLDKAMLLDVNVMVNKDTLVQRTTVCRSSFRISQVVFDARVGDFVRKERKPVVIRNVSKRDGTVTERYAVQIEMWNGKKRLLDLGRVIYAWYNEQGIGDNEILMYRDGDNTNVSLSNMYAVKVSDAMKKRYSKIRAKR